MYPVAMVLWMLLALMTGAAVLSVIWPLSRRTVPVEPDGDVPFYKAQLVEIDRDRERGVLDAGAADAARIEAGRRLLKAAAKAPDVLDATSEPALRRRRAASAFALSVVPLIGLAIYGDLGSPKLLGQPAAPGIQAATGPDEAPTALLRVEEHLAAQPDDVRGWDVIAPIYLRAGRLDDAARAFRRARLLGGDTVERLLGEGEALVGVSEGVIGAEAGELFRRAVEVDPGSPAGRYYVALMAEQRGDAAAARAGYRALLDTSKPDAPWVPLVSARLARLDEPTAPAARIAPGAVPAEVAAMVSGLDERLRAGGGTAAEWSRLVRSFVVLGRRDDALDRLEKARVALATDRDGLAGVNELARELGLRAEVARR